MNHKVAVIGSGGREHAILKKLKENKDITELYAIPGNAGMAAEACLIAIDADDVSGVVRFCTEKQIDYVVVTPDNPLALGMVDALRSAGIMAFGPDKAAARIESSKVFAKNLMQKYHIPTADYAVFDTAEAACKAAQAQFHAGKTGVVVKADGLALGKGVSVCHSFDEAKAAITAAMVDKKFGASGERILIEELLEGPEVSVLAFTDGKTIVPMVSSMDHKRAFDNDKGPNTGGMGTIAPNPFYSESAACESMRTIFLPTIQAMQSEGAPFSGCLYFGLMLTKNGPKVIEYNCRFGDPETQVVLPLLQSDLYHIMRSCTEGVLDKMTINFSKQSAACIILASQGYPGEYQKGFTIDGIADAAKAGAVVYCAGVAEKNGALVTAGGRVLGISALGSNLTNAVYTAYSACSLINFEGCYFRRDIGAAALEKILQDAAGFSPASGN